MQFIKIRQSAIVLTTTIFLTAGCVYPVKISSECQAKINACLKNCDGSDSSLTGEPSPTDQRTLTDYRSQCESNCHSMCQ
ncbi:MAG: hypothetical protein JXX29_10045 [Deltaproteobacteria bacterium]|nr:hypothetical protein [Deltaproteobacteria bacterium]MBN2672006.1 hypothetical protein [Deltaproteobacteria bacterium]